MNRAMKRNLGRGLLGLSLLLAAVLMCGYFARASIIVSDFAPTRTAAPYREIQFAVDEGRMEMWCETWPGPPSVAEPVGIRLRRPTIRYRMPSLKRSLASFDAHVVPLKGPSTAYLLACPIWCFAIPLLAGPGLWLRKWRRSRLHQEGFPIEAAAVNATT